MPKFTTPQLSWLTTLGKEADIVLASRVRLARNLKKPLICPSCHMSYQDFTRTGKIGCSDCYKTFALALEPLLRRIHGSSTHIGKIPNRAGGTLSLKQEILNLRKQITKYVEAEEYEQAAVLRDRIKVLENQLHAKQNLDKGVDQNA